MDPGNNIVQRIDFHTLAKQFIEFFYNKWIIAPEEFLTNGLMFESSKMNFNGKIVKGVEFIGEMIAIKNSGVVFTNINCNALDSGSRRIDIMVNGFICNSTNVKHRLSIFFLITYQNESWKLQNSILNIFI
jgi:hypothetical protein